MLRFPAQILPMMGFSSCDDSNVFQWLKLVSIGGSCSEPFSRLQCRWDIYTEGDNLEPAATNICPVFTIEQLTGTPVLVHAGTMEDPTPSNTLDHDALTESITTAYAEDELTKKICEQIKTTNQPDGW